MDENRRKEKVNNLRLEVENLELKAAVEGKDKIIQLLREEIKTIRESKESRHASTERFYRQHEVKELHSALLSKEIAVKQLKEELTNAYQNTEQVHQQYACARGSIEAKDATISRLHKENDRLQEVLEIAQNDRLQTLDKLSAVQAELSAVRVDKSWLESQLKLLQESFVITRTISDSRETVEGGHGIVFTMESVAKDKQTLQELINTASHYEEIIRSLESGKRSDVLSTQESYRFASVSSPRQGESSPRVDENYVIELGNKMTEVEERLKKAVVSQKYQLQTEREQLIQEFRNMQMQLLQHQRHHEVQKNEMSSKETLIERLKATKAILKTEVETLKSDLAASRAESDKYLKEQRKFQHELISSKGKISKLEAELENERRQRELEKKRIEEIGSHSHSDRDELSKVKIQLREQCLINENHARELDAKDNLIKQIRGRLENSEYELDKFKSMRTAVQVSQVEVGRERENLQEKLLASEQRFTELQVRYDEYRLKNEKLQRELQEYRHKHTRVDIVEQSLEQKRVDLENDLVVAQKKLSKLENAYEACQKEKLQLQQELIPANTKTGQLKNAYESCQQQKSQLQQEVLSSHKKLGEFEAKLERQRQEKADVQHDMKVLENKYNKVEQQLQRALSEKQSLLSKLEEANRRVLNVTDDGQIRDNQWYVHQKKYEELSLEIHKREQTMRQLQEEKELLEAEIQRFKRDFETLNRELAACQREKASLQSELTSERQKNSDFEKDCGRLRQEREKLQHELNSMKDNNAQWKDMCEKIQEDKERLQGELLAAQRNISRYEANHDNEKRSSQQDTMMLRTRISGLESELQQLRKHDEELKIKTMELQRCKADFGKVERDLDEKSRRLERLMKDTDIKENLHQQLKKENVALRRELESTMKESGEFLSSYVPETTTMEVEFGLVQNQLADMSTHMKELEDDRDSWRQKNLHLQKQMILLEAKNGEMEKSYIRLQEHDRKLQDDLETCKSAVEKLEKELFEYQESKNRVESAFENSEFKKEELSKEILDARKKLSDLEKLYKAAKTDEVKRTEADRSKITKLESQIDSLTNQKNQTQQLLMETRDAARRYQDELHKTQAQLQELQRFSEIYHKDIHSKETQNKRIRLEKESIQKELESMQVELVNTASNVESFDAERYELIQEMRVAKDKMREWESAYKILQQEHEAMEKELRNAQKMVNEVEDEFNKSHKEHQNEVRTSHLKISKFESQVQVVMKQRDSLKDQLDEVRQELRNTKDEYTHLQKEFIQHQQRCDTYRKELLAKSHMIEKLEEEKNSLQRRMEEMRIELGQNEMTGQVVKQKSDILEGNL